MKNDKINLEFTRAEALVLFEFIARADDTELFAGTDSSEQKVVWLLEGKLEKVLVEILSPNYRQILDEAKQVVANSKYEKDPQ